MRCAATPVQITKYKKPRSFGLQESKGRPNESVFQQPVAVTTSQAVPDLSLANTTFQTDDVVETQRIRSRTARVSCHT